MPLSFDNYQIYDISPLVSADIAVFPWDVPFKRNVSLDFNKGDNLILSAIETSVHIGAHTDGPNHYHPNGGGIDKRDIQIYMGPCQVIEVSINPGERIKISDFSNVAINANRILFKTLSF
jgi:arylformamidase